MFRRVELINRYEVKATVKEPKHTEWYKNGLMAMSYESVVDAWIYKLRGPKHGVPRNAKFYFTEKGWAEVGREVIRAAKSSGQMYRVVRVKENSVNVVWRDKHTGYEVAVQPLKEKR